MIDPFTIGTAIIVASGGSSAACLVRAYFARPPRGTADGIGEALRQAYEATISEPVPDELQELLKRLD